MRPLIVTALLLLLAISTPATQTAQAAGTTVHLAPEFSFLSAGNKTQSLRSLRGQSVVLVITDAPTRKEFKKQVKYLQEIYQQFASKQVVFVAAMTSGDGPVPSNVPFAIASNPAAIASAYGVAKGFQIAIIGRDGNLDYQTAKVLPPERVRDVVQNSYDVQASARKAN